MMLILHTCKIHELWDIRGMYLTAEKRQYVSGLGSIQGTMRGEHGIIRVKLNVGMET